MQGSSDMKQVLLQAICTRCGDFEKAHPAVKLSYESHRLGLELSVCVPKLRCVPAEPDSGIFARLLKLNSDVGLLTVSLSSAHKRNTASCTVILSTSAAMFGTDEQSESNMPWIELQSKYWQISPKGFGMRHGWHLDSDMCQTFVIEAALGSGPWENLADYHASPLSGIVILEHYRPCKEYFDRFRIRMTGPNSSGSWYLMIAWFDVFGEVRSRSEAALAEVLPTAG